MVTEACGYKKNLQSDIFGGFLIFLLLCCLIDTSYLESDFSYHSIIHDLFK